MALALDQNARQKIAWMVEELPSEFDGEFDGRQIEELMADSVARLAETAAVVDFIPLMAYRFTRERLNALTRATAGDSQGEWDVVFVSLSGGGRGQIAAALTTLLSENRVSVHSAGTAAHGQMDPGVRTIIAELGIDPDEAFARPIHRRGAAHGRRDRHDGPQRRRDRPAARRPTRGLANR